MELPQQHCQPQHQTRQDHQQSVPFRNSYAVDVRIPLPVAYYGPVGLPERPQHPPYEPPVQFSEFRPGPIPDGSTGGAGLPFNFGLEPPRKRLKEREFFNSNSPISSVEILQAQSVSTGLGLSFDNTHTSMASLGGSPLLSLLGDDVDQDLQRQDKEIDRFLQIQADQMRKTILEKTQQAQSQTMSLLEEKYLQKLCEKESEVRSITRKNKDLEDQIERLIFEAGEWQQEARNSENTIAALNFNLQQIYAESRDSIEGCGESEVDDTASCCDGGMAHSRQLGAVNDGVRQSTMMKCKACGVHEMRSNTVSIHLL
ncbi:uncharacterized protein LOC116193019 isoform X2 [Punica granatum]|uniref:Uncharacterized protein LOC116193019 isoform X2 n=1 Tax=Punica granatum TaxID=22663 RepID=A0A6P8C4Y9_PUNGR|nr:uncharacterized protein LOC116193019 isoform X2 [Punica granatum]